MQIPLGIHNLNQLVLISKNWPNDSQFRCERFVAKSLDDFRDLKWKRSLKTNLMIMLNWSIQ